MARLVRRAVLGAKLLNGALKVRLAGAPADMGVVVAIARVRMGMVAIGSSAMLCHEFRVSALYTGPSGAALR